MITKFTKDTLTVMRADIQTALNDIAKKHGLEAIQMKNITYSPDGLSFTTRLEARVKVSASPEAQKAADEKNTRLSHLLGYSDNIVGETFSNLGRKFTVTLIDTKKRTKPIIAHCDTDGKTYVFPAVQLPFENAEIKFERFI